MSAGNNSSHTDEFSRTVRLARDLIQIDTTNFGAGKSLGEDSAAGFVEAELLRLGLEAQLFAPEKGRTSVLSRIPGRDGSKAPLVLHGHLDVVPADPDEWSVDPFGGVIQAGYLWGRGAVDMKNMNAMILASAERLLREAPAERDIILAFLADEEDGGHLGAHHLVDTQPDLFAGATHAVGEVGGYSIDVNGKRAYLVQTAEKSLTWLRLVSEGEAGHGSRVYNSTAVTRLADAIARLSAHEWPIELLETTEMLVAELRQMLGLPQTLSEEEVVLSLGAGAGFVHGSLKATANTTVIRAGEKQNVVPAYADALVDVRALPGSEEKVIRQIQHIVGVGIRVEVIKNIPGIEASPSGTIMQTALAALREFDPECAVIPYMLPGGTDNKAFSKLGIEGYGFAPLQLPASFDFAGMFHNVDERVPLSALDFGTDVLTSFLRKA